MEVYIFSSDYKLWYYERFCIDCIFYGSVYYKARAKDIISRSLQKTMYSPDLKFQSSELISYNII